MSTLSNPVKWLIDWLRGGNGNGDEDDDHYERRMTADACLRYAPVWYAVSRIAGHIGQLPLVLHERIEGGAEPARTHPAYRLLKSRPNKYQSAFAFKQFLTTHALLCGNGRALVLRAGQTPIELLPLDPYRSGTYMVDGEKWHVTILQKPIDGIPTRQGQIFKEYPNAWAFPDKDIFHVMGLSLDGIEGLRISDYAARSFGLGIDGEKQAAKQTKKGFSGSLMLEAPPGAFRKEADAVEFLKHFRDQHSGSDNAGAIGLLREGIKANVVASNNKDMQALESRQFQRQEVALWFLLEHILGDSTSVSYNSLVERNLAYLSNCLGRWIKPWEEEGDEKLLTDTEKRKDSHFCRFSTGALLKTDMQTTATTISILRTSMVLTANEGRALLDYNPIVGGDTLENPATSAQGTGNEDGDLPTDSTGTRDREGKAKARNQRAIESMLGNLIGVECKRAIQATSSANFVAWIDSFYAKWEPKLADAIETLGGDRTLATEHCAESKSRLLDVAGFSTADDIEVNVGQCVSTWPGRVQQLILELELRDVG